MPAFDRARYDDLQTRTQKARADYERAQGVVDEQRRVLKEEYGVDSPTAAKALIAKMREEQDVLAAECQAAIEEFEAEFDAWQNGRNADA